MWISVSVGSVGLPGFYHVSRDLSGFFGLSLGFLKILKDPIGILIDIHGIFEQLLQFS